MRSRNKNRALYLFVMTVLLLVVFAGCDLFTGPAGVDGIDGGNAPGGWLSIQISGATSESIARIVFDPDINVLDGDEIIIDIALADYISPSGLVFYDLAWRALDVAPGSYFLYAWIDLDGDGSIEIGSSSPSQEGDTLTIYSDSSWLTFDSFIDPTTIIDSGLDYLSPIPNYTLWDDFAPQVTLYLSDATSW